MPAKKKTATAPVVPAKLDRPWGAHMSIAGGLAEAIPRGASVGAKALQIFTKNNNQWTGKPLTDADIEGFAARKAELGVAVPASHDCYLINLCAPDPGNHKKSFDAFVDEMDRADLLGIPLLVFHPGSHLGTGESAGIAAVAATLDRCIEDRPDSKVTLPIETTAGQGTNLGWRFEQIADIIGASRYPERFGVCVDTCHIFAAGYELRTAEGYAETFAGFDRVVGLERIRLFHVNDSKRERGSRVDRHEHIGKGHLGLDAFRHLVNDSRFFDIPMVLETPKGADCAEDAMNLRNLAQLITT